jgi:hypothetical protein
MDEKIDVEFHYLAKFRVLWGTEERNSDFIFRNISQIVHFQGGSVKIDDYDVVIDHIFSEENFSIEDMEIEFCKLVSIDNRVFDLAVEEIQAFYRKAAKVNTFVSKSTILEDGTEIIVDSFVFQSIWPDDIPWYNGPDAEIEIIESDLIKEPCDD